MMDDPNAGSGGGNGSNNNNNRNHDSTSDDPAVSAAAALASFDQAPQDIPFLVTHYLANFAKQGGAAAATAGADPEALEKIRRATNDIASAFASLGAFGTTTKVCA
jgi:hypothetical protein